MRRCASAAGGCLTVRLFGRFPGYEPMPEWHLIFQRDGLPISLGRDDGTHEVPPPGLTKYVELAHGAWTLEPATAPAWMSGVEWPRPCVWRESHGCLGAMVYVEHSRSPVTMAQTGEILHPACWQCDTCGNEEVDGFSVRTDDVYDVVVRPRLLWRRFLRWVTAYKKARRGDDGV